MRVCIVPASGQLRRYMVEYALDRGYEMVGVCREESVGKLEAFKEAPVHTGLRAQADRRLRRVWAVDVDKKSTYKHGDREITVPGLIVSATTTVMRTEGVIVQELEVQRREAAVSRQSALANRGALRGHCRRPHACSSPALSRLLR